MSITPASGEIRRLRKEIDRLLDEYRPDRYIVRVRDEPEQDDTETENGIPDLNPLLDDTETKPGAEWLDSVAAMAVSYAPMTTDPRVLYVRKVVGEREGVATKRANQLLRTIKQSGQLVLGWWGVENNPVAITWRIVEKGKRPRITDERVAAARHESD